MGIKDDDSVDSAQGESHEERSIEGFSAEDSLLSDGVEDLAHGIRSLAEEVRQSMVYHSTVEKFVDEITALLQLLHTSREAYLQARVRIVEDTSKVSLLRGENSALQQQTKELVRRRNAAETAVSERNANAEELRRGENVCQTKISSLEKQIEVLDAIVRRGAWLPEQLERRKHLLMEQGQLNGFIEKQQDENQEVNKEVEKASAEVDGLKQKLVDIEAESERTREDMADYQKEVGRQLVLKGKKDDQLRAVSEELKNTRMTEECKAQQLTSLVQRIGDHDASHFQIDPESGVQKRADAAVSVLGIGVITVRDTSNKTLMAEIDDLKSKIGECEAKERHLGAAQNSMSVEISRIEKNSKNVENAINENRVKVTTCVGDSKRKSNEYTTVQGTLNTTLQDVDRAMADRERLDGQAHCLKASITEHVRVTLVNEERTSRDVGLRLRELTREHGVIKNKAKNSEAAETAVTEIIQIAQRNVGSLQSSLETAKSNVANLKERTTKCQREIDNMKESSNSAADKLRDQNKILREHDAVAADVTRQKALLELKLRRQVYLYEALQNERNHRARQLVHHKSELLLQKSAFKVKRELVDALKEELQRGDHGLVRVHFQHNIVKRQIEDLQTLMYNVSKWRLKAKCQMVEHTDLAEKRKRRIGGLVDKRRALQGKLQEVERERSLLHVQLQQKKQKLSSAYNRMNESHHIITGVNLKHSELDEVLKDLRSQILDVDDEIQRVYKNALCCIGALNDEKALDKDANSAKEDLPEVANENDGNKGEPEEQDAAPIAVASRTADASLLVKYMLSVAPKAVEGPQDQADEEATKSTSCSIKFDIDTINRAHKALDLIVARLRWVRDRQSLRNGRLGDEFHVPLQVHRWRRFQNIDDERLKLIKRQSDLQKEIVNVSTTIASRTEEISKRKQLVESLKHSVAKQASVREMSQTFAKDGDQVLGRLSEELKRKERGAREVRTKLKKFEKLVSAESDDITLKKDKIRELEEFWVRKTLGGADGMSVACSWEKSSMLASTELSGSPTKDPDVRVYVPTAIDTKSDLETEPQSDPVVS